MCVGYNGVIPHLAIEMGQFFHQVKHFSTSQKFTTDDICDALQQNREQVAQAYFEIWTIEVGMGRGK